MNQNNLNYSGQYLDDKYFKIKIATGGDIYQAAETAVAGEMFLVTGVQPALYAAKSTSAFSDGIMDHDIYKVKDLTNVPKIKNVSLMEFPGITTRFNDYSLSFNGVDDYLDTNSTFQSTFQSAFSVSMWFKFDDVSANDKALFGADNTDYYDRILIWKNTSNQIAAFYTANQQAVGAIYSSGATVTNWNHLVYVVQQNGSSVETELYINGVSQDTSSATSTMANYGTVNTGADVFIGAKNEVPIGGHTLPADALIDEAAIIPSALSLSDVTAIYNSGVPADLTSYSPVSWWRMGDAENGSGTTITDQGSGGNDGTINGATFSNDIPQ
jgi:hypothetical protein